MKWPRATSKRLIDDRVPRADRPHPARPERRAWRMSMRSARPRGARSRRLATVVGLLPILSAIVLVSGYAGAEERQEIPHSVPARLRAASFLGAAAPDVSLPMSLTLRIQHEDELDRLTAVQQTPGSPDYHRWLTPAQFAARFAPAPEAYAALVEWLQQQGFTVSPSPTRLRIDFTGTVR